MQSLKYLGSVMHGSSDEDITDRGCDEGSWCDEEGSDLNNG